MNLFVKIQTIPLHKNFQIPLLRSVNNAFVFNEFNFKKPSTYTNLYYFQPLSTNSTEKNADINIKNNKNAKFNNRSLS